MTCGGCGDTVLPTDAETCWFCDAGMCFDCWDEFGHCGHEAADLINQLGLHQRAGRVPMMGIFDMVKIPLDKLRAMLALAEARIN